VLKPPAPVLEIAERLESAGYETWCVGGAVRDAMLGHEHLDWDLATAAEPRVVQRLFRKTIPVGIDFGTVGVIGTDRRMYEVTTFRRDVTTDGRHAVVQFGVSLEDDLARRDFTINAIAFSPSRQELFDPFGGRDDLARRVVRTVGLPDERLGEDRLRALRAIRFAARFGFSIDPDTWGAIERSAPHLGRLSPERVKQELEKSMEQIARPSEAFSLWISSGAMATLIPPLASLTGEQLAVIDHLAIPGLPGRPQRKVNRVAALLLPLTAKQADAALRSLRFSNSDTAWITSLVRHWGTLGDSMTRALIDSPDGPDDRTLRRWVVAVGRTRIASLFRIAAAVWAARRAEGDVVRRCYSRLLKVAWNDPVELADLAVDGDDLRTAGLEAGPALGKILHELLDMVLDDPSLNTREQLLSAAVDRWRAYKARGER
jgi:tRNA nucleotidyltransferase (CCA-adding enzyme)